MERGDVVRAHNKKGKYRLRTPFRNGDGWWATRLTRKGEPAEVVPIRPKEDK